MLLPYNKWERSNLGNSNVGMFDVGIELGVPQAATGSITMISTTLEIGYVKWYTRYLGWLLGVRVGVSITHVQTCKRFELQFRIVVKCFH